ncbi:hypothetical protein F4804DRAFT_319093 [Jackrogersella minutella]|nr:hypothetical protein F4804DRAFT_319093 [Jackrogersella minutella]
MSTTSLRPLLRIPTYLLRSTLRPTTVKTPVKILHHAVRTPHLRPLSSTLSRPDKTRARVLPTRNSFAQVRFKPIDVPGLRSWEEFVKLPVIAEGGVSAVECHEACQRYAALAVEDKSGWRKRVLSASATSVTETGIPLSTLHYAALMLMQSPAGGRGHIATHILHSGVLLDYPPAVLAMARLGLRSGKSARPQFELASEALARLANTPPGGKNAYYRADALTLRGLHAASPHTRAGDDRALHLFVVAAAAAASEGPWQWAASAALEQSRIYVERGQPERAREVLRPRVEELDNADVCLQYALLLRESDPERLSLLERAAVSGVEAAARELGRMGAESAKEPGLSPAERVERRVLADEWMGIARDKSFV